MQLVAIKHNSFIYGIQMSKCNTVCSCFVATCFVFVPFKVHEETLRFHGLKSMVITVLIEWYRVGAAEVQYKYIIYSLLQAYLSKQQNHSQTNTLIHQTWDETYFNEINIFYWDNTYFNFIFIIPTIKYKHILTKRFLIFIMNYWRPSFIFEFDEKGPRVLL